MEWHASGAADGTGIVGESPAIWRLREAIAFLGPRAEHVLIQGPSGTGKELAGRALHAASRRCAEPWVARNASTIPEALMDAELFGNMAGYPNPGMRAHEGLVGRADGGSLFLDEIGELPHPLQAHLLRLMDAGEYHRLGDPRPRTADIRVLAATNRAQSYLKHDLGERFPLRLELPGLDTRREDIPLLVLHLLRSITSGACARHPRRAPAGRRRDLRPPAAARAR